MKLYRADKRDFCIGDIITTAGEFLIENPGGSNVIEEIFESIRPNDKPKRAVCLYLFEDLTIAKKHWSKMTDGNLYEVEVNNALVLHRADMQFVDKAFASESHDERKEFARQYWEGDETENPRIEILVSEAKIVSVISKNQNERRQYLKSWGLAKM